MHPQSNAGSHRIFRRHRFLRLASGTISSIQHSEQYKLTHLFFFSTLDTRDGTFGCRTGKKLELKFPGTISANENCADELGLPLVPVNSNMHSFFQVGHLENCSFVTPGAALLMQRGIGRYYLASEGHTFKDKYQRLVVKREQWYANEIDPLILPYMSTENMLIEATETHLSRMQKTKIVADLEVARRHLNVCGNHDAMEYNCSCCDKCVRTMGMLEVIGKLDAFTKVFKMDYYRNNARKYYFAKVIAQQDKEPFNPTILAAARERGINLREHTTFLAILWAHFKDTAASQCTAEIPDSASHPKTEKIIKWNKGSSFRVRIQGTPPRCTSQPGRLRHFFCNFSDG